MPNVCFTKAPEPRTPAADGHDGSSKACVLRCLSPWAIKNIMFSKASGVTAPIPRFVA